MKQITVESKASVINWESIDGLVFESKEKCEKHETALITVLQNKYSPSISTTQLDLFGSGNCDTYMDIVKVNSMQDVINLSLMDKYYNSTREVVENILLKALENNDYVICISGYSDGFYFKVLNTGKDLLENIKHNIYEAN